MNSFEEVETWLASTTDYERMAKPPEQPGAFDLARMRALCAACGDPQDAFGTLHVAGSKGKGTVAAYAAAWARAPGRTVGLYTSPHLVSLRERIVIDGSAITPEQVVAAANVVRPAAEGLEGQSPTFFEVTTAMAFVAFVQAGVDVAVIEVGLGGRLDATNVVTPLACAITTIDLEHTALLGDTLAAIAREKAGICKPGVPVVIGRDPRTEVVGVLHEAALAAGALPLRFGHELQATSPEPGAPLAVQAPNGRYEPWPPGDPLDRSRALAVQTAVALCDVLPAAGLAIDHTTGRAAVQQVRLPGRCDLRPRRGKRPALLIDGAHTPLSIRHFAAILARQPSERVVVFACMQDKQLAALCTALSGVADRLIATTLDTTRSAHPRDIANQAKDAGIRHVDAIYEVSDALKFGLTAAGAGGTLAVAGSLYLAGRAYEVLLGMGGDELPVLGAPPSEL